MPKKANPSPYPYPITMKQVQGFMVITSKDFNISYSIDMPEGYWTSDLWSKLNIAIGKCWIDIAKKIKAREKVGIPLPNPSKISSATENGDPKKQIKPLTAPAVARILGVSENSVRRIPKKYLKYSTTRGGHRRYSSGAVISYQELYKSSGI